MKEHAVVVGSVIVYAVGVALLLQLHTELFFAKTYVSENALLIGEAETSLQRRHVSLAASFTKRYHLQNQASSRPRSPAQWLVDELDGLGVDAGVHHFVCDGKLAETVVAIIRAPRTSGSEAIVLSSRYRDPEPRANVVANGDVVDGMGLALGLMDCLSDVQWLSKDLLLVLTPDRCGEDGMADWLHTYYYPKAGHLSGASNDTFFRAGLIRGALNLNFEANSMDYILISLHGKNGALPNLDLVNAVDRSARYVERKKVILYTTETPFVRWLYENFNDYLSLSYEGLGMLTFAAQQAIGLPSDDHGLLLEYNIEALTLGVTTRNLDDGSIISFARVVEMCIRSLSNLSENLHQSFYYYLLPVSALYVSIGQYMIPLLMIVLGSFLAKAHTAVNADGHHYLEAFMRLCVVSAQGPALYLLADRPVHELVVVYGVSVLLLAVLVRVQQRFYVALLNSFSLPGGEEEEPKRFGGADGVFNTGLEHSLAIVPLILFIALSALKNFSFCAVTAVTALPLFVVTGPSKHAIVRVLKIAVLLVASPPIIVIAIAALFAFSPQDMWSLLLVHHSYASTLAVPFLTMVYAPIHTSIFLVLCGC